MDLVYSQPASIKVLQPGTEYQVRLIATASGYLDSEPVLLDITTTADTNPPEIRVNSSLTIYIEPGQEVILPEVTATDNVDGVIPVECKIFDADQNEIESIDTSIEGEYQIRWTATDASGNTATATGNIYVTDAIPPEITLNPYGDTEIIHPILSSGTEYVEYGATATDRYDGPVEVSISGNVGATAGVYSVVYTASDSSGNTRTVSRTVVITSDESPALRLSADVRSVITLQWSYLPNIPLTLQRREADGGEWENLAAGLTCAIWSDATALPDTRYEYRLLSATGDVLSNTYLTWLSDTMVPEITIHPYGESGHINASIPVGGEYVEYGASAMDRIDSSVQVEATNTIDITQPSLQSVI